jgi:hypothetical protein
MAHPSEPREGPDSWIKAVNQLTKIDLLQAQGKKTFLEQVDGMEERIGLTNHWVNQEDSTNKSRFLDNWARGQAYALGGDTNTQACR